MTCLTSMLNKSLDNEVESCKVLNNKCLAHVSSIEMCFALDFVNNNAHYVRVSSNVAELTRNMYNFFARLAFSVKA